jgi:hypothetical protein
MLLHLQPLLWCCARRTIMRRTEKLPGRAAPKERPKPEDIREFVLRTGGGEAAEGRNDLDDFFELKKAGEAGTHTRPNQVCMYVYVYTHNQVAPARVVCTPMCLV